MPATFTTTFASPCGSCGRMIPKDTPATWEDDEVVHVDCPGPPLDMSPAQVCVNCNMVLPKTGRCDECD